MHAGLSEGDNPLQLRDVAALLRKGDDPNAVLKGLAALGPLVDAAPHELDSHAGEISGHLCHMQTLLDCVLRKQRLACSG